MEFIDDARHTERLLALHTRRLHKLEEQWALDGPRTNPAVIIEIEDLRPVVEQMRASLIRPPAPARLEDLSGRAKPPAKHRGLIVLVGTGRAGANPMTQAAGEAIAYHLAGGSGVGLEQCWLLPSGVEELDPEKARVLREQKKQRDAVEVARALAQECAAHGVQARIRPVGEAFNMQATYEMVRWIFAADLPAELAEQDVICDFTGGTKLMSAGMILACGARRAMQCMVFGSDGKSVPVLARVAPQDGQ